MPATRPLLRTGVSLAVGAVLAVFSTGCTTTQGSGGNALKETFASDDPCSNSARNTGIAAGAAIGALAEYLIRDGKKKGVPVTGLLVGGLVGGFIGHDMDRRRCELSKIAKANNLDLAITDIKVPQVVGTTDSPRSTVASSKDERAGMSVAVIDHGEQFAAGSAIPSSQAAKTFAAIADQYKSAIGASATSEERAAASARDKSIHILLVGHTDDTGSSRLNADLSEARAREVAKVFAARGFSSNQIFYQGAGETLPIADNRAEEGRAKNRRVEIVDLSDAQAFAAFLADRKPNLAFYRTTEQVPSDVPPDKFAAATTATAKPSPASASRVKTMDKPGTAKRTRPAFSEATRREPDATAVSTNAAVAPSPSTVSGFDFGGTPATGNFTPVDIGRLAKPSQFKMISSAYAGDEPPVSSCVLDRPRISHGVKSLRDDKPPVYATTDYLPGVYDTSWSGMLNGHLVALTNVAVLRDGGAPARRPVLLVYRNYKDGDVNAKPAYRGTPEVNTYRGDKALLYRIFTDGPMRCIDMVVPNASPGTAPNSNVIYARSGQLYQAAYSPRLVR